MDQIKLWCGQLDCRKMACCERVMANLPAALQAKREEPGGTQAMNNLLNGTAASHGTTAVQTMPVDDVQAREEAERRRRELEDNVPLVCVTVVVVVV